MAQVLVTGGTGFIGHHLVTRLVARGEQVRCLVRSPARAAQQLPAGAACVPGDVTAAESLAAAVRGVDVVYHLAGANLPLRPATYHLVNAAGTRSLAETCARQERPPVFVHVSSLAAAGPTGLDQPLTEAMPPRPVSEYGRTKLAGEGYVRAVAERVPATIVRPPAVFGPGDPYTIRLFRLAQRGLEIVPGRSIFQLSWIYVGDLVEALLLAAERGERLTTAGGEQGLYYAALDTHPTVTEATRLVAEAQGRRRLRVIRVPAWLCRCGAWFNAARTPLTGRAYWVNPDKLREVLAGSWTCSPAKAKRDLGFACRTELAEGFRLTYAWYRAQGWC